MKGLMISALLTLAMTPPLSSQGRDVGVKEKLGNQVPMEAVFRDEDGRPVRLGSLVDRPTLLSLNYFTCTGLCTPQLMNLADALDRMRLEPGKDYRVLTVSFDPKDTPAAALDKKVQLLKEFSRPFPPEDWRFLTGDEKGIRALTEAVGYYYMPRGDQYLHAGLLLTLTQEGKISRYIYGISYLPFELQMALDEASRGLVMPTVAKVVHLCFTYDPNAGTYAFKLLHAAGLLIVASSVAFLLFLIFAGRRKETHA